MGASALRTAKALGAPFPALGASALRTTMPLHWVPPLCAPPRHWVPVSCTGCVRSAHHHVTALGASALRTAKALGASVSCTGCARSAHHHATADSNLLITRGLIGRLTNTSYADFRYNVQNVADYLASAGIHAVSATPRTISELQGMKWILQPPNASQTRNPQEVKTIPLMDGSIALSFNGYQATRNHTPRRMSNFDTEGIQNDGEEEFVGVFIESEPTNRWEALGQPDTNPRWDTLGEPSGRYNFYVNYAAPPSAPFIPPSRSMWDDDDDDNGNNNDKPNTEVITEAAFPSIWEDTSWEEDPYLDIYGFDEETHNTDDDEEDLSAYFMGLENLENDYPISPNTVLPSEQQVNWEDSDSESEQYWQNTVEQVEQIEEQYFTAQTTEQMGELSLTENSSVDEDKAGEQDVTNEIAHAGIEAPLLEQLEGLEYPILRSMMNQALNENAFSSTSAISRRRSRPKLCKSSPGRNTLDTRNSIYVGIRKLWMAKPSICRRQNEKLPTHLGGKSGVDIKFEHISGTSNELADALSRLVHHITNKASISVDQKHFLQQVDESLNETQGADDTLKDVLAKTIVALMTKATFEKAEPRGAAFQKENDSITNNGALP
ncbi:hypothetical protein ZIOFF_066382 [Zingiber officinale]|uniref:Uncharacterized protein n=1 Tax=Zingiber officinale TaxID=94328 RepID=A0A8J5EYJ7_ZINOF|nr:hypothetical protein ZIOFF_066382 [Zingiber officinale]